MVEEAVRLNEKDDYDQVWCVFDRDEFSVEQFNAALELARNHGFNIAYSNEAFEFWYLLHFEYCDTPLTREEYTERLDRYMLQKFGYRYQKNDPRMYDALLSRQAVALRNAERVLTEHGGTAPYDSNPSTTVHLLVQELLKNSRR